MARLFPGGTATDVITTTTYTSDANTSIALWVLRTGSGGGNLGRLAAKGTTTVFDYSLFVNGAVLQFEADFTTMDGRWTVPWGTGNDNAWRHVVVTYNNSAVSNNPSIYINGVAQTVTRAQAPVGVFNASASKWFIGNNTTGVRVFQGLIAEFAAWAKILTATDVRTLADRFSPLFLVGGTRAIVPLIDATTNYRGVPNTVTGTTSAPHLNIFTPVTNHSFYGSAPPPTANADVANYPLPLTISPATTRVTSLLALPSLATTIEVGDINTSVLARPSVILLPLSVGAIKALGTAKPQSTTLGLSISAISSRANATVLSTSLPLTIGAISTVEVGGTVSAVPPNIPLPLTLGAITTKTTALVRCPSLALQMEVADITLATTAKITPGFVSLPIAISPISTRTTALARTSAILLPLTVSSVVARGEGAITPPATLLPLTISAIATSATAKTTVPNIGISLLVSGASTKTTAFAFPGVAFIGLTVSAIGTKTTAYLLPPSISLPLTVWEIKSYSIGVIPVTYGGRSNVTLRNRIINIETVTGKTQVENIGGRTDVGKGGETDIESEVVW